MDEKDNIILTLDKDEIMDELNDYKESDRSKVTVDDIRAVTSDYDIFNPENRVEFEKEIRHMNMMNTLDRIMQSVITPAVVAFVTCAITIYIFMK